jgi:hypothetical protein
MVVGNNRNGRILDRYNRLFGKMMEQVTQDLSGRVAVVTGASKGKRSAS